ncbi:hypothetical protein PRUPE_7G006900 [Prunus persica]|uniref:Uncharacterized protein n=1 Tax=Prunus persica TaxID=3760 RepID=A0A251N4I4_PRUPE|nr:hypothetical protein PRUPE_7G006900 [Prunus persica]
MMIPSLFPNIFLGPILSYFILKIQNTQNPLSLIEKNAQNFQKQAKLSQHKLLKTKLYIPYSKNPSIINNRNSIKIFTQKKKKH